MLNVRKKFPMLINNKKLIYFDNAALALKPKMVIKAGNDFYEKYSISSRTADSKLGVYTIHKIDETREHIAKLVDANSSEVIFSSGTTDSLNMIARMLTKIVDKGQILLSYFNHSSNIIPFIELFSQNKDIKINYFSDQKDLLSLIDKDTKIVALSQITNNFNVKYDLKTIYKKCKKYGTILINDAAQAIAHERVSLNSCDVIAFSANKLYGPTGMGALIIKNELKSRLEPVKWGGGQVHDIDYCSWTPNNSNAKFEPGTANLAGIFQFDAAIDFVNKIGYRKIKEYENALAEYLYDELSKLNDVEIRSSRGDTITLFNIKNIPTQDVASYLGNEKGIYVRAGKFCAQMLSKLPNFANSYIRVSLSIYNNKEDIDKLISALKEGGDFIEFLFK